MPLSFCKGPQCIGSAYNADKTLPGSWSTLASEQCRFEADHRYANPFAQCPCGDPNVPCSTLTECTILDITGSGALTRVSGTDRNNQSWTVTNQYNDCHCPAGALRSGPECVCPDGYLWDSPRSRCYPSCPAGTEEFLGTCIESWRSPKVLGKPATCVANPCDAGTGQKFQEETIFDTRTLRLILSYNSTPVSLLPARPHPFGNGWSFNYGMRVWLTYQNKAGALRADGRMLQFLPPSSGNHYVSEADIPDRLERLVDTGGAPIGWKYTVAADDSVETYAVSGQLVSIVERNGNVRTLTYSDATTPVSVAPGPGLLIRVEDHFGRQVNLIYDLYERVTTVSDPADQRYVFRYDEASAHVPDGEVGDSSLTSVEFPDRRKRIYHYNEQHLTSGANRLNALTGITDEDGNRFATYGYGSGMRTILSEHAGAASSYSFSYDPGVSTVVTDPLGAQRTYRFQEVQGAIKNTSISGPACPACGPAAQTYDSNGFLQSKTDWNGNLTMYFRQDSYGRPDLETSRTEAFGAPEQRTVSTEWHPSFRLPARITEPGRTTSFQYDAVTGDILNRSVTDTSSGSVRVWTYTYISGGRLRTADGPRTDVADLTTYDYYPDSDPDSGRRGNLRSITNALAHVTQISSYDANGRPLTIVDPNGLTTALEYWPRGWLKSRNVGGEITRYDYWPTGLLRKVTQPDNSHVEYAYDPAHRLTEIKDNLGNRIVYTLDAMGNRTRDDVFDQAGTLRQRHERVYDTLNRLWKDIGGESPASAVTEYGYDNQGNQTKVIYPYGDADALGNQRDFGYDALNRLRIVTDPKQNGARGITRYGYNPLDQLTSVTDPMNLTTRYTPDALDNVESQISPDTGITSSLYDDAGNLISRTDARGKTTSYVEYDALNRLRRALYHDGTQSVYTYDEGQYALGRLTRMNDPGGIVTRWTYDQHGRVKSRQQTMGVSSLTLSYGYDSFGRLQSLTYPSGKAVTYGYDAAGRINSIQIGSQTLLSSTAYHPFGAPATGIWGNGSARTQDFDLDGRFRSFNLGPVTITISHDNASRITSLNRPGRTDSFFYDNLDRLERYVPSSGSAQTYTYDDNGNRRSFTLGATTRVFDYGDPFTSNRLMAVTPGSPARSYQYDPTGNVTADGTRSFVYNDAGRLARMQQGTNVTTYAHNALGQRVRKTGPFVSGAANAYLYDEAGHLVGEYQPGGVLQETVWLYDTPIGVMRPGSAPSVIHTDHLGTPRLITNPANRALWRWDFDPFGILPADSNPSGLGTLTYNLRFPGQFYDTESGMHYNYYRDYDPQLGRYIQSDPIGLRGGLNTYAYAYDNPLRFSDPTGECPPGFDLGFTPGRPTVSPNSPLPGQWEQSQYGSRFWGVLIKSSGTCGCGNNTIFCDYLVEFESTTRSRPWDRKKRAPAAPWGPWETPITRSWGLFRFGFDCASGLLLPFEKLSSSGAP